MLLLSWVSRDLAQFSFPKKLACSRDLQGEGLEHPLGPLSSPQFAPLSLMLLCSQGRRPLQLPRVPLHHEVKGMEIDLGDLPTEVELPIFVLIFLQNAKLFLRYRKTGVSAGELRCPQYFYNTSLLREAKIWLSYISSHSALGSGWVARTCPLCRDVIFFCVCRGAPEI